MVVERLKSATALKPHTDFVKELVSHAQPPEHIGLWALFQLVGGVGIKLDLEGEKVRAGKEVTGGCRKNTGPATIASQKSDAGEARCPHQPRANTKRGAHGAASDP